MAGMRRMKRQLGRYFFTLGSEVVSCDAAVSTKAGAGKDSSLTSIGNRVKQNGRMTGPLIAPQGTRAPGLSLLLN